VRPVVAPRQAHALLVHRPTHGLCRSVPSGQRVKTMNRQAYGFRDRDPSKPQVLASHGTRHELAACIVISLLHHDLQRERLCRRDSRMGQKIF
jgi:hypothetical protein